MPINTEFYYPDPQFSGFTIASYIDEDYKNLPSHKLAQLENARDRKRALERKRELDPVYYQRKVTAETMIAAACRARRDPKLALKLAYEPEYWEKSSSYYDARECEHVENYFCKGCQRYVKPKLMHGTVCDHCDRLIPKFGTQSWDPVVLDKRLRDEHGVVIDKKRVRPKLSNEAVRLAKVDAAEVYKLKNFETAFIKNVVLKRIERELTQEQLAHLVNRPCSEINRFESGQLQFDAALKSQLIWKLNLSK
jgi:hypothetical protein